LQRSRPGKTRSKRIARPRSRKRKLLRDTIDQAKQNYKTVEDVLLASNSRQVKAVGHAVQTIRRLEIGVEGSKAAVKALREGAEALGVVCARRLRRRRLAPGVGRAVRGNRSSRRAGIARRWSELRRAGAEAAA
jgi:hypothetical protein